MGTLAVTAELHAKQQEAARKEAERAARKAPQDAAADAKGEAGEPASKKGSAARSSRPPGRSAIGGRACRAQAGRPGDGTRWDTGTRRRRPAAQAGAAAEKPATLAGRHVAAYLFQNFPSPLLQLFVVVEPEHSGEGRFQHVRLGGAVVETVHFYLFLEGPGVAMALCMAALAKSLHSL